jgi:hypothetical protein
MTVTPAFAVGGVRVGCARGILKSVVRQPASAGVAKT